jgi:hypothetical protein
VCTLTQVIRTGKSSGTDDETDADANDQKAHEGDAQLSTWNYYLQSLAPLFVIGLVLNIFLAAYIFTRVESGLSYADALWHCWITAWTVGYGDISLASNGAKLWASFHIILSVSWLTNGLQKWRKTYLNRKHILQRAKTRQMQLSDELIDALDRTGDGHVTELDFVVEMIIALGAEVCGEKLDFKSHVQPLMNRFAVLDEHKRGYLTKEDVTFMLTSARAQAEEDSSLAKLTNDLAQFSSTKKTTKKWRRKAKVASLTSTKTVETSEGKFRLSWSFQPSTSTNGPK